MSETTEDKSEVKPEKSVKLTVVETEKARLKPPFKLCFVLGEELGRSYILPSKPTKISFPILAPKFYSKYDCQVPEDPSIFEELKRLQEIGPREKYAEPITENQRYGWYTDSGLDCDRGDRRLYFPRRDSQMVKIKSLIDHTDSVTKSK